MEPSGRNPCQSLANSTAPTAARELDLTNNAYFVIGCGWKCGLTASAMCTGAIDYALAGLLGGARPCLASQSPRTARICVRHAACANRAPNVASRRGPKRRPAIRRAAATPVAMDRTSGKLAIYPPIHFDGAGRKKPCKTREDAPVAQWIEQRFPKPRAQVRLLPGASTVSPLDMRDC
jgi:hypothetical protein